MKRERQKIIVNGIVQGVGFRPFVYRLANEFKLTGYVLNDASGLTIEIQGCIDDINSFIAQLKKSPPPLARIDNITINNLRILNEKDFVIEHTQNEQEPIVMVSPDKSSCPDCLADIVNPKDRHYKYPFTNCTNCGPRYSIIEVLPYDRCNTSMANFKMCPSCGKDYNNPNDRRYHAQPVSCPACGPQISIKTNSGNVVTSNVTNFDIIITAIKEGKIVAIKGLGGFHIICDATNYTAVNLLRERKRRLLKPLAIMVADIEMAKQLAIGNDAEWKMLNSIEKPIVLLTKKNFNSDIHQPATAQLTIADNVAPNIDKIGMFLPYTPLHQLLMHKLQRPIVATSANLSGEPVIGKCEDIVKYLGSVVDLIVDNNRDIINCCDDSVIQYNSGLQTLRLARGYAPYSFRMNLPASNSVTGETGATNVSARTNINILAVGAQQKNTICFGFKHNIVLSPHIGDLSSIEAEEYFMRTLQTFKRLYQFDPYIIIGDLHPDYASTKWAKAYSSANNIDFIQIQHHYAHILSIMARNNFTNNVLGFAFDGTGVSAQVNNKELWGGEIFIANVHDYKRISHLQTFKLIGGEQAIKEPSRLFLAILFEFYSLEEVLALPLSAIKKIDASIIKNLHQIWLGDCIRTSSIGRLFDAIAYGLELLDKVNYDGESGLLMETAANQLYNVEFLNDSEDDATALVLKDDLIQPINFDLQLTDEHISLQFAINKLVDILTAKQLDKQLQSQLASGFMLSIVDIISVIAEQHPDLPVVLAGGVFQNKFLYSKAIRKIGKTRCLSAKEIPINDGGIALGQLWYGLNNMENIHIN